MIRVRFAPSDCEVAVPAGTTLLEATRLAGLPIARACRAEGLCAGCGVEVLDGPAAPESDAERSAKARNRTPSHLRLACRVRLSGDVAVTASYW